MNLIFQPIITESELINLVETRGIGVYPFKDVIDEIANYIQSQLDNNLNGRPDKIGNKIECVLYTIQIPESISSKFDWIDNFNLVVNVRDVKEGEVIQNLTGGGNTQVKTFQQITNVDGKPKLNIGNINIDCYSVNKQLQPRTLYLNLYHEFNHNWENYNRLLKYKDDPFDKISGGLWFLHDRLNYNTIANNFKSNPDKDVRDFCELLYRLWIPDEYNALIASTYGDLKGMDSKNYQNDYTKTTPYKTYMDLKNNLERLSKIDSNKWKNIIRGIVENPYKEIQFFKNKFISQTEDRLVDLFHRINKTASLYYENKMGNISSLLGYKTVEVDKGLITEWGNPDNNFWGIDMIKCDFDEIMLCEETKHNFWNIYKKFK